MPDILELPGYAEAVEKERLVRDASFLPINESIAGFEVRPMTLAHYMVLRMARSPMLPKFGTPSPVELTAFLWLLSPDYSGPQQSPVFLRRCREFIPPSRAWLGEKRHQKAILAAMMRAAALIEASRAYVTEALQDRPPRNAKVNFQPDYYSDACYYCAAMGREYGYPADAVLAMPLKQLFQFLNEMKEHNGGKVPLFNPSDAVRMKAMQTLNENQGN